MKHLIFCLLCAISIGTIQAQEEKTPLKLRLGTYHQDLLIKIDGGTLNPVDPVKLRPGFNLGVEKTWKASQSGRLYQSFVLGFYNSPYHERWITVGTELGYEFTLFDRLIVGPVIGLHYNAARAVDVRYEFDGERWVRADNHEGTVSRLQIALGLDLGYNIIPGSKPIDLIFSGKVSAVAPYLSESTPLGLYYSLGAGVRMGF